ncbi:MAG: SDR family NAD(P)-dependent oxidoreductase [Bacillota bacterium]|jgi:3-oxoacyl-[acyl-carrier protein] reductase
MELSFQDKVVLVTGATSGIGESTARLYAQSGAVVFLLGRNEEKGQQLARSFQEEGWRAEFYHLDVTDEAEVNAVVEEIYLKQQKIDILVHSAGFGIRTIFTEISYQDWKDQIEINLHGSFLIAQAVARKMKIKKYGKIVFISSGSIITGTGGGAPYVAAKAGQVGLTRAMAHELAPYNINVNVIGPRNIETPMFSGVYSEEGKRKLIEKIPLGRIAGPEEIAGLALYLTSDIGSYITGQFILVDGGRTYS